MNLKLALLRRGLFWARAKKNEGRLTRTTITAAAIIACAVGLFWFGRVVERDIQGAARATEIATAQAEAVAKQKRMMRDAEQAAQEYLERERAALDAAGAARRAGDGLRSALAASARRNTCPAGSSDAARVADLFAECGAELERVAREADRAVGQLTLLQAWARAVTKE
jgi:hypothetical protein